MSNLTQASHEWATRPDDERFESLEALYLYTLFSAQRAKAKTVPTTTLRVKDYDGDLKLVGGEDEYSFNHWSFGQTCRKVGAPSDWLRKVPADLAAKNLNYALETADKDDRTQLWYDDKNSGLRAATGDGYTRILNHEVVKAVVDLGEEWCTPPARPARPGQPGSHPATLKEIRGSNHPDLGVKVGDIIANSGIYGSDRNMFIFRTLPKMRLDDGGSDGNGLCRGFFVRNSEVGDASFELVTFWFKYVCGNHIVWGAQDVKEMRLKHVGRAPGRAFDALRVDLDTMAQVDMKAEETGLQSAKRYQLGSSEDTVIDFVFSQKKLLTRKNAAAAYGLAEQFESIDNATPTSAWGFAQGVTRLSQQSRYADERTALDRAAGKILALATRN